MRSTNGDASTGDAGECPTGGEGTLALTIRIPDNLQPDIWLDPGDSGRQLLESQDIQLPAGSHTLRSRRVVVSGAQIGHAYSPALSLQTVCVSDGSSTEVSIEYKLEPGSEKLWVVSRAGPTHTTSYNVGDLASSGAPKPATSISGAAVEPSALAFDREGNLWLADRSGRVLGYRRDSLGADRSASIADIVLEGSRLCVPAVPCGPNALAFDGEGDLWLALPDRVAHIRADQLKGKGEPLFASSLTGPSIDKPQALAFDASGALWVANGGDSSLVRFQARRLGSDDDKTADVTILGQATGPVFSGLSNPLALAFDEGGNLWVGYYDPRVIVRYAPQYLEQGGVIISYLQLSMEGLAIPDGLAFDDAGNLWTTGEDQVVGIPAESLMAGLDLRSSALILGVPGPSRDLAFDPPAANTPLTR